MIAAGIEEIKAINLATLPGASLKIITTTASNKKLVKKGCFNKILLSKSKSSLVSLSFALFLLRYNK
jgi:hypothetical protein